MKPEIKNGILIAGNERIILAHVQKWKIDGSTVVFFMAGTQISLMAGSDIPKLDAELLTYFEKKDNPWFAVSTSPAKNLTDEQMRSPLRPGTVTHITPEQLA